MDFQIAPAANGRSGSLMFTKNTDILTSIWLSLNIEKGYFFQNPDFGLRKMTKIVDQDIPLYKQYVEQALAWLIRGGRAKTITVLVEKDLQDVNRLNIKVNATQPDGLIVTYTTYQGVI